MSRCSQTPSVVAAMFERGSLDAPERAHVNACAKCGEVLAAQRRFEVELSRAAAALTLEAMAPDLASGQPLQSGGQPMRRSHMALMAAGFVAVVAAVVVASPWIATTLSGLAPNPPTVGGPRLGLPDADDRRGVHQELILDITNNRDAALVLRIVPQILDGVGLPAQADAGVGDGSPRVEPQARRTLRLRVTSEQWTLTLNGTPFLRSTDHEFISGGWTAGRIVVDPDEMTSELERSQPAPSSVTAPRGQAPGRCSEVTEFAYAGVSTLRDLGFDDSFGEFEEDFERRGRFWITRDPVPVIDTKALEAAQQAAAARARAEGQAIPPPAPPGAFDRPEQRMLCVTWADGNPTGLVEMAIPEDWSPPSD